MASRLSVFRTLTCLIVLAALAAALAPALPRELRDAEDELKKALSGRSPDEAAARRALAQFTLYPGKETTEFLLEEIVQSIDLERNPQLKTIYQEVLRTLAICSADPVTAAWVDDQFPDKTASRLVQAVEGRRPKADELMVQIEQIRAYRGPTATKWMVTEFMPAIDLDGNPELRPLYQLCEAVFLDISAPAAAQDWLGQNLFEEKIPGKMRAVLVANRLATAPSEDVIKGALEDKAWQVRLEVLNHLNESKNEDAQWYERILNLLKDPMFQCRVLAVKCLYHFAKPMKKRSDEQIGLIEKLIDVLRNDKTLVREHAVNLLAEITGRKMPANASAWASWLIAYKAGRGEGPVRTATQTDGGFGFPGDRVIFVLDVSSSMLEKIENEHIVKAELARRGLNVDWSNINNKYDLAVAELNRSIEAMNKRYKIMQAELEEARKRGDEPAPGSLEDSMVAFTVVAYSTNVNVLWTEMMEATDRNLIGVANFLRKVRPRGRTNISGALDAAMAIAEGEIADSGKVITGRDKDKAILADTIIFLTDGYATDGRYCVNREKTWDVFAKDSNGRVNAATFRPHMPEPWIRTGEIDALVRKIDRNGDGGIDRDEFLTPAPNGETGGAWYLRLQMRGLCREIASRNTKTQLVINTVGIGEHDEFLLSTLATDSGGEYLPLGLGR
jgi:hypothetical protein